MTPISDPLQGYLLLLLIFPPTDAPLCSIPSRLNQKAIVSEKITVEEKLRRTDAALRDAIEDNHVLRSRCSKLTEVVASLRLQVEDQQAALMAQVWGRGGK